MSTTSVRSVMLQPGQAIHGAATATFERRQLHFAIVQIRRRFGPHALFRGSELARRPTLPKARHSIPVLPAG